MFHVPRAKMNHTRGGEEASCKIAKLSPRGARTRDRAHLIKILALILYVQMILAGGIVPLLIPALRIFATNISVWLGGERRHFRLRPATRSPTRHFLLS